MEAKHQRFEAESRTELDTSVALAGRRIQETVKGKTWFRRRSDVNSLKDSISISVSKSPKIIRIRAWTNKKYAPIIEHGTRKRNYPIRARKAKCLFFYWEKMGKWVWTKKVTHPGIEPPYKFLRVSTLRGANQWRLDMMPRMQKIAHHF